MTRLLTAKKTRKTAAFALLTAFCATGWISCTSSSTIKSSRIHHSELYADLVIVGGRIWTGQADPPSDKPLTALASRYGRIIAIGTDIEMRPYVGPNTKMIDARARRIIPGITDSHTHIIGGGLQLDRLTLRDVQSKSEFIQAVADKAKTKNRGEWILGGRWSVESWRNPESPIREWLDPFTKNIPVFLSRMDGHSAVVNTAALSLAGIDRQGPKDPKGGEIVRDPQTGQPTGILKESAMSLVRKHIPDSTTEQNYQALQRAIRHANSLGVTSVHDMCTLPHLKAFRRAEKDGTLLLRITAYLQVGDWTPYVDKVKGYGLDSDMLRIAGFKGYMDGSLGSRTAYMHDHYSDATDDMPYPRGQLTALADPQEKFQQLVALADSFDYQIAMHAIGDQANHQLLNAYEYTLNSNNRRYALYRAEHVQHLLVPDIQRFGHLGVVASMQPFHKADDGRYAEIAIGKKRLAGSYAFRQLLDSGAILIFGSDWPVVTLNPFKGIDSAVNARTLAGDVWLASHSLTVEEALRAYTVTPPTAIHRGDRLGTLEVGKYADLVILHDDPLIMNPDRLGYITVAVTIVNGEVVYEY